MLQRIFPPALIHTLKIRLYTFFKIPLINHIAPRVVALGDERTEVIIPLSRRTRNHVNSVYFGALAVGADLCIGLMARYHVEKSRQNVVLLFKDFKTDFKKLAKSDAHFICDEGLKVRALVEKTIASGTRQNATIHGYATCPQASGDDIVMDFDLTLSLKVKA